MDFPAHKRSVTVTSVKKIRWVLGAPIGWDNSWNAAIMAFC
jgi:uncharacterized membrane protein